MIYLIALVILISFFEIRRMVVKQQKKEIVIFLILAVISLALGYFYLLDPYRTSLAQHMLKLVGKQF